MMDQKAPAKGLRIALAISVAVNLAVAGVAAGMMFRGGGGHRGDVRDLGFGPFTEALSREDREALRRGYMDKMPDLRAARQGMRADQRDLLAALRAEPFDQAALEAVLSAQSARTAAQLSVGQGLLRDLLVAMTPEARISFAERLEARLGHGRDGGKP